MKEQRRLAAIMFTDIVGYTAIMSKDEQKALQILQKNRDVLKPLIEQFNGEWLKEIGDGTLSSFSSAVEAVNCAMEIQRTLGSDPELNLRIGIHIGDVVFAEGDVFGDGVNVASRIELLAKPGGICISEQVYDAVRNKPDIGTVYLGEKTLKNVDRPIKVHALTGVHLPTPTIEKTAVVDIQEGIKAGTTISHYRIIEKIGEGGMGVVYKAEDTKLKRTVALKFLRPEVLGSAAQKTRFFNEARAAAALDHPSICTVYEIDEAKGYTFIAMAFIDGKSLKKKMESGPLKTNEALDIAIQTAEGLVEAHKKGVIHRDIKPENILLTKEDQTKIVDFGIAKYLGGIRLTKEGTALGTVAYMPPEQARGEDVDHRADIWSLGVVIYEKLTGQLPFKGANEQAVMYSILNEEQKPVQNFCPELSPNFTHVLNRALEKDPADRYQSARDMLIDLRRLKRDTSKELIAVKAAEVDMTTTHFLIPKRKIAAAVAAVVGVIAIVIAVLMIMPKDEAFNSLAILPFTYTGSQEDIEFLSEGIPDIMVESLHKVSGLSVYPFESVMYRYGKEPQDPILVGNELNMKAVMSSKITSYGNNITISISIVDVRKGRVLHSQIFEEKLSDIAYIPTKIAKNITELLSVKITGEEAQQAFKIATTDPEAIQNYMIGRSYAHKRTPKDLETALVFFEEAVKIDPGYAEAYTGIADAYHLQGDHAGVPAYMYLPKARNAVEKALELDENLAEAHTSMGGIYRDEGKYEKAKKELERAIEINPNYVLAYHWLGLNFQNMGNREKSIENYFKALALDPVNIIVNSNLAISYRYIGQTEKTIEQYEKNIELNPENDRVYIRYGNTLSILGEHESAIEQAEKALALDSLTYDTIDYAVLVYQRAGQFDKAIAQGKRMIELYPQAPAAFSRLASVCIASGGNDKVIEEFEKIIKQYPQSPAAFNELGIAYRNAGEYEKAIEQHNKAIETDPLYPEDYNSLGVTYKAAGDYDKAEVQFKKAIEHAPNPLTYLSNLGNLYMDRGEIDKAFELYENAIERDPDWARLYNSFGVLYRDNYEYEKAIDIFEEAIERSPDNIVINRQYGRTFTYIGEHDKAIEQIKKALEIGGSTMASNNLMGLAYYYSRQFDKAIEYYKKALQISPNNEAVNSNIAIAYLSNEQYKDAAEAYQKWFGLRRIPNADEIFGECFARGEYNKPSLQKYLMNILEASDKTNNPFIPRIKAYFYAYMDETDSAIVMLNKAFDEKDINLPWLMSDPVFDNLRSDPRFQELLTKMNLDKYIK